MELKFEMYVPYHDMGILNVDRFRVNASTMPQNIQRNQVESSTFIQDHVKNDADALRSGPVCPTAVRYTAKKKRYQGRRRACVSRFHNAGPLCFWEMEEAPLV
jgi:hypothetical protein